MAKIINLSLSNYQGIVSQDINLAGVNVSIYGRNGTGKSTIANAIAWLLYDKPADGAKNYTPKTHGVDGHIHNLEHSAEMVIEIDGGTTITLKRVYHEIYHKKRGSNIEEFDGHATDHFIDGVPITEKEYKTRVAQICPPDMAKILTQPWYFAEAMTKDERRRVLLEVCGDVSDKEVIDATPEIADLPEILRKPGASGDMYSVDEYRRIAAAQKAKINEQLKAIPSRIDEAMRAVPELTDNPNIDNEIANKRKEIVSANEKLAEIKKPQTNEEADANLRTQITKANADLAESREKYQARVRANESAKNNIAMEMANKATDINVAISKLINTIEIEDARLERMKSRRGALFKEYNDTMAQVWDTNKEICPTCKQPLPAADLEKMKSEFNLTKSNKLNQLQIDGKAVSKEVIAELETKVVEYDRTISDLNEQLAAIEEKRKVDVPKIEPFEKTEDYKALSYALNKLQQERAELNNKVRGEASEAITAQEAVIKRLSDELQAMQQSKANKEQADKLRLRIKELEEQEKQLAGDYERTERGLYVCELFVRAKVSMLTDTINGKFSKVKFRLFKEQINGGLTDDCEVKVPGQNGAFVPWSEGANTGAKINAGLEIIKILGNHYNTKLPIVCDNAECVSEWTDVDAQLIRLIVTTTDDKLRIEYD